MKKILTALAFSAFALTGVQTTAVAQGSYREPYQPTYRFSRLPHNVAELKSLREASLKSPAETAALTVLALNEYPRNKDNAIAMLQFLMGPRQMSPYEKQFLRDRFEGKPYLARSFFDGATPGNNYTPTKPYAVTITDNPYSYKEPNYATLYLQSGGADSPRSITLRLKPSTGQWFLWEQRLLSGIRIPAKDDPWH